jgi:hypothetical protein
MGGTSAPPLVADADMTKGVCGTIRSPLSGAVTETACACKSTGAAKVKRAREEKASAGREGRKLGLMGGSEGRLMEYVQLARIFKRKNCTGGY